MAGPTIVVLDYGSGNVRSAVRALERADGTAEVVLTADRDAAISADGLVVPGVGAFAACMAGLRAVDGERIIDARLIAGRPVLGICVGMQILFGLGVERGVRTEGAGQWPGTVDELDADVLPHMGWNTVDAPEGSSLFAGLHDERFYFVHSYGARTWEMGDSSEHLRPPLVTWTQHGDRAGGRFIAAVENGPLSATQFHPEKSGDAGISLLRNWIATL